MNTHRFPPEPRENDFLTYTAVITRKQKQVLNRKCQVCDNFAPNHFHYGGINNLSSTSHEIFKINFKKIIGICCFACRAFFRRTYVRLQKQKVMWIDHNNFLGIFANLEHKKILRIFHNYIQPTTPPTTATHHHQPLKHLIAATHHCHPTWWVLVVGNGL